MVVCRVSEVETQVRGDDETVPGGRRRAARYDGAMPNFGDVGSGSTRHREAAKVCSNDEV